MQEGDFVVVRDNTQKNSLVCFGIFEVTGKPYVTNIDAPLIWGEELSHNKIIFNHRVPVRYIKVDLPIITKDNILNLKWKKRIKPFNEYKWQGLSRLFAVNFPDIEQAQQLAKLWGINFETLSWQLPDEIRDPEKLIEGAKKQVVINAYERDPKARLKCIEHYGYNCSVCKFNFQSKFGELGNNYIHIHHLRSLASIGESYEVDPIVDLRPVCPNCHAMLHKKEPPYSIDELKAILLVSNRR